MAAVSYRLAGGQLSREMQQVCVPKVSYGSQQVSEVS
jgi:hypothetical protein